MEIKARGRRRGSKNYAKEFRTRVVAETLDPARSLSEVAGAHGLNANLVSKWRRDQERAAASASEPAELFLPIKIASPPMPDPIGSSGLVGTPNARAHLSFRFERGSMSWHLRPSKRKTKIFSRRTNFPYCCRR